VNAAIAAYRALIIHLATVQAEFRRLRRQHALALRWLPRRITAGYFSGRAVGPSRSNDFAKTCMEGLGAAAGDLLQRRGSGPLGWRARRRAQHRTVAAGTGLHPQTTTAAAGPFVGLAGVTPWQVGSLRPQDDTGSAQQTTHETVETTTRSPGWTAVYPLVKVDAHEAETSVLAGTVRGVTVVVPAAAALTCPRL
jgi:hypothetical protein